MQTILTVFALIWLALVAGLYVAALIAPPRRHDPYFSHGKEPISW